MNKTILRMAVVLSLTAVSVAGCKGTPGAGGVEAQAQGVEGGGGQEQGNTEGEARQKYYSPYYLTLQGGDLVFRTVTFEDVGMKQPNPGEMDPLVHQTIAESLSKKFSEHEGLNYRSKVLVDESLKDPANHLFCEAEHLYVALWRGYEPDRWGYSLWSGCGEDNEFAWKEVLDPVGLDGDLVDAVAPLAESIAESVYQASEAQCYLAHC
ncbi:hypothetical protein DL240_15940 [Lujinxingia litoralis]|uniref:Lipoprotein n=1 Tax=Lujinxingia litoralis TaxID=2211119 RepID=A0A328C2M7_9DELT|nr:hypothetical protein [Lujinxingia litoralis]RAL20530.1 hypothetical protein DL240_15940 [Lujinxingia litoralis]